MVILTNGYFVPAIKHTKTREMLGDKANGAVDVRTWPGVGSAVRFPGTLTNEQRETIKKYVRYAGGGHAGYAEVENTLARKSMTMSKAEFDAWINSPDLSFPAPKTEDYGVNRYSANRGNMPKYPNLISSLEALANDFDIKGNLKYADVIDAAMRIIAGSAN